MVRVKRRYILIQVKYDVKQTQEAFIKELRGILARMYGDFGVACFNRGFSVKKNEPKDGFLVLSVRKGVHEMVMSALPLISTVDNVPCSLTIVHLSGTIRGCLKHLRTRYVMNVRAAIAEQLAKKRLGNT